MWKTVGFCWICLKFRRSIQIRLRNTTIILNNVVRFYKICLFIKFPHTSGLTLLKIDWYIAWLMYQPIFGFCQYIARCLPKQPILLALVGIDKRLLYSLDMQTTCTRKHNEQRQDSYPAAMRSAFTQTSRQDEPWNTCQPLSPCSWNKSRKA